MAQRDVLLEQINGMRRCRDGTEVLCWNESMALGGVEVSCWSKSTAQGGFLMRSVVLEGIKGARRFQGVLMERMKRCLFAFVGSKFFSMPPRLQYQVRTV